MIKATQTARQTRLLIRLDGAVLDPAWAVSDVGLEDIILAYMGQEDALSEEAALPVGQVR